MSTLKIPPRPPLLEHAPTRGPAASGLPFRSPFRPSIMAIADLFARPKRERIDPNWLIPLPFGIRFILREQLRISLGETFASRFKRVFGYSATIELADSAGALTPACCQVVLKLPWRYTLSDEESRDSFIYVSVNAYTPLLCIRNPARVCRIGDIVSGFLEKSGSEYYSAHLTGWGHVTPPSLASEFPIRRTPAVHSERIRGVFTTPSRRR